MDDIQRERMARQIRETRELRGWSKERLAGEAKMSVNTVRRLEEGQEVRPGSLAKALRALEIEPTAEAVEREGSPVDVHLVSEVIRMWLMGMPESERPAAVFELMQHVTKQR